MLEELPARSKDDDDLYVIGTLALLHRRGRRSGRPMNAYAEGYELGKYRNANGTSTPWDFADACRARLAVDEFRRGFEDALDGKEASP